MNHNSPKAGRRLHLMVAVTYCSTKKMVQTRTQFFNNEREMFLGLVFATEAIFSYYFLMNCESQMPMTSKCVLIFNLYSLQQYGDSPLHTAARYGHAGVLRILISAFANVNETNKVRMLWRFFTLSKTFLLFLFLCRENWVTGGS